MESGWNNTVFTADFVNGEQTQEKKHGHSRAYKYQRYSKYHYILRYEVQFPPSFEAYSFSLYILDNRCPEYVFLLFHTNICILEHTKIRFLDEMHVIYKKICRMFCQFKKSSYLCNRKREKHSTEDKPS